MKFSAIPRFPLYASPITVRDTFDDLREIFLHPLEMNSFKTINYTIPPLYLKLSSVFGERKRCQIFELRFPDYQSYSRVVRARVVFVCGRGADVDYRKLCKGENQCTQSNELRRERDKGRQRKTQSLREEREKGDSSRNTEREESFPGRCLAPNCMPESDCISSSFSLPFSPSLFHSRSSSLAR